MSKKTQIITSLGVIVFLIISFGFYGLYRARAYLDGPQISIETPQNGQSTSTSYTKIKGKATNIASLFLNGRQIFSDKEGNFEEGLLLTKGYNIIEVRANDKFGREIKKILELVFN